MRRRPPPPGPPPDVVRRAPFADNPQVGARGQRTQQRILDAALEVFGESGYHECGVDAIATRAGCSRAAFYQYFSSKEDVFRHLAGQVARQLDASHEALGPLSPDAAGWRVAPRLGRAALRDLRPLRARVRRLPGGRRRATTRSRAARRAGGCARSRASARGSSRPIPPRELDPLVLAAPRVRDAHARRRAHPAVGRARPLRRRARRRRPRGRHAPQPVRAPRRRQRAPPAPRRPPILRFDPVLRDAFAPAPRSGARLASGRRTREALLEAGRKAFVERGYHRTCDRAT